MTGTNSAVDILNRTFEDDPAGLSVEAAQAFLRLRFRGDDVARMNELAEKARAGSLNPAEAAELHDYEMVGYFVSALKSNARRRLAMSANGS